MTWKSGVVSQARQHIVFMDKLLSNLCAMRQSEK